METSSEDEEELNGTPNFIHKLMQTRKVRIFERKCK